MLIQLEINDFAIIEHSIINFKDGFNVISGETGAGKSILFDALSCIIGERTSKSVVRKGKDKAELTAVFLKTPILEQRLKEKNIVIQDDVLIVKRTISVNGRSIALINGSIHTTQTIKEVCADLVEICGQKAHLELLQEDKYLHWLDNHADVDHRQSLLTFQTKFTLYKSLIKEIEELLSSEREKEQLLDLYRFQKDEIGNMNLQIGEDDALEEEKKFLSSFEKISRSVGMSVDGLSSIDSIFNAKVNLDTVSKFDERLIGISERIERAYYELEDAKQELDSYINGIEYDEQRLNDVMYRLDSINQLKRKYANTIEGILDHHQAVSKKVNDFDNKDEKILSLQKQSRSIHQELQLIASDLHRNREVIAKKLEQEILLVLKELCMPDVVFKFNVTESKELHKFGNTEVTILFNANKGEEPGPLSKIASGGELSRVLLSMKIANNQHEEVSTIVFDEIDEGIGGEVGRVIGQKLFELGNKVQVIAISHLPQVAAKGNHHFLIQKNVVDERTLSKVAELTTEQRIHEIARMIYGDEMNETTLQQAKDMLKKRGFIKSI